MLIMEQENNRGHIPWPVPTGGFQMWLEMGLDCKVLVSPGLRALSQVSHFGPASLGSQDERM